MIPMENERSPPWNSGNAIKIIMATMTGARNSDAIPIRRWCFRFPDATSIACVDRSNSQEDMAAACIWIRRGGFSFVPSRIAREFGVNPMIAANANTNAIKA